MVPTICDKTNITHLKYHSAPPPPHTHMQIHSHTHTHTHTNGRTHTHQNKTLNVIPSCLVRFFVLFFVFSLFFSILFLFFFSFSSLPPPPPPHFFGGVGWGWGVVAGLRVIRGMFWACAGECRLVDCWVFVFVLGMSSVAVTETVPRCDLITQPHLTWFIAQTMPLLLVLLLC